MKNFNKANKPRSAYKDTNAWLNSVYKNNKEIIDEKLSGRNVSPKTLFKRLVKEQIEQDKNTPTQALKTIARSRLFTEAKEMFREHAWSGLAEDPKAYKRFRELTKEKGRYTKFDPNKLVWNKRDGVYVYNDEIVISFQNSPKGTFVYRMLK
jgi:hypothetical protein